MAMTTCPKCGGKMRNGKCLECKYTEKAPPKGQTSRSGGGPPASREVDSAGRKSIPPMRKRS